MFLIFTDVETTGLSIDRHTIIQIAAYAVDSVTGDVVSRFERKILFRMQNADPKALELNVFARFKNEWERIAKPPQVVADEFIKWLEPYRSVVYANKNTGGDSASFALMVAWNAEFDSSRLVKWFGRMSIPNPFSLQPLCMMDRTRWWWMENPSRDIPKNFKLPTIGGVLELDHGVEFHDASGDVEVMFRIYQKVCHVK